MAVNATRLLDDEPELVRIHDLLSNAEHMARRACVHAEDLLGVAEIVEEIENALDSIGDARAELFRFEDRHGMI